MDLPLGSFGHAYGQFMGRRHFLASERPPVRFVDDAELAYVAQRARETHDLWHVLFDCPTTVCGELALKGVEFVQVMPHIKVHYKALINSPRSLAVGMITTRKASWSWLKEWQFRRAYSNPI